MRNCLVQEHEDSGMDTKYYRITSWGCVALDDPNFDPGKKLVECIAAAENAGNELARTRKRKRRN